MANENVALRWIWRSPLGWTLIASTMGVFTYSIWNLLSPIGVELEAVISSLGLVALGILVTLLGLYLIYLTRDSWRLQAAWWFLTAAIFSSVIAECLWVYFESVLHVDPFPSVADIFYLLYYPLTLLGVLMLPFAPAERRERVTLILDLAIILNSAGMLFWYYLVAPMGATGEISIASLVAISYPLADLLLLAAVVALVQRNIQRVGLLTLFLFAFSFILNALADTLYAYYENNGVPYSMDALNVLWMASLLALAYAFAVQIHNKETPALPTPLVFQPARRLLQLMLPYAAAFISLVLMFFLLQQANDLSARLLGVLYGSLLLVALVLARQYIVLRQNVRLVEEMRIMASTDSLTSIYNRHFFNEVFRLKINQAERYGKPLSILLMDVDSFKQINDTFGHLTGDEVLREVARLLSAQLRSADLIARFGGDEFVVILPETDFQHAQSVAQRLDKSVAGSPMDGIHMSVSIGLAEYSLGQSPEEMLEAADKDLYQQKSEKTQIRFRSGTKDTARGSAQA